MTSFSDNLYIIGTDFSKWPNKSCSELLSNLLILFAINIVALGTSSLCSSFRHKISSLMERHPEVKQHLISSTVGRNMFLHSCTLFIFQKTSPNMEILIHSPLLHNLPFSASRLSLSSSHGNIIPSLIFSLVRCWVFLGGVEGRAFLFKPVLGADQARPPVSPWSPIKTATNAIPQCTAPWNLCRNGASHERMHRG